jgi:hypothetical protein
VSKKKINSRWRAGATRYSEEERRYLQSFREREGWRHGARVYRRVEPIRKAA